MSCLLPITDYRLPITDYRLPITDCRLPTTDCRLPTTDYRLPIVRIIFLLVIYLLSFLSSPLFSGTFVSNVAPSGNWSASGSWTLTGGADADGVPDGDDDVTILAGDIINLTANTSVNNLTIVGTLNYPTNNRTLTVNTDLIFGAGAEADVTGSHASRVLTVNGSVTVAPAATADIAGIQINFNGLTTLDGTLTFTNTTGVKTLNNVVVSATGTWDNDNVNEDIAITGDLTNNNVQANFISGTGTYTFSDAVGNFNGDILIQAMSITGAYTNNGTLSSGTSLSGAGSLTQAAGVTLNIAGSSAITTLNASIGAGAGAGNIVNYNGAANQTIKATNYEILNVTNSCGACTVNGTGTYTAGTLNIIDANVVTTNDITVTGSTSIAASTELQTGSGASNFGGTVGTVTIDGTLRISSSVGAAEQFNNIDVNATGSFINANNEDVTINGDITNDGVFTSGSGDYTLADATGIINGAGLTISNVIISATGAYTNNIITAAGFSVTSSLSGTGSLAQSAGSELFIGGTITITTLNATNATAPGNQVTYNGGSAQTVKATTYNELTIDKTSNDATLGGDVTIESQLTMTLGDLILSGFNLILDPDAAISGGSTVSFINADLDNAGRIIKQLDAVASLGALNLPTGDASGDYSPLTLTINSLDVSAGAQISIGVQDVKDLSNTSVTDYIDRWWDITATNVNSVNFDGVMQYVDPVDVNGTEGSYIAGVKNASNQYKALDAIVNAVNNTITFTGAPFFGDLTGGEASAFPIKVCCFKANLHTQNDVKISWFTLSEKNSLRYVVERGIEKENAILWSVFDSIPTKAEGGNSTDSIDYELYDYDLPAGVYYYRLWEILQLNSRDLHEKQVTVEIFNYEAVVVFGQQAVLLDGEYEYSVFDITGRKIKAGVGREILLYGIKKGVYVIKYGKKIKKLFVFLVR